MSTTLRTPVARKLVAFVLASVFVAGSAVAQTRGTQPAAAPAGTNAAVANGQVANGQVANGTKNAQNLVTYKQKTTYDFDDDQVEGTLVQPDTDLITGILRSSQDSLVRLRTTFQPEMLKSVESL